MSNRMTPQEKWQRFSNPKTVEDYGLSMTEAEIRQVPEAMAELGPYIEAARQAEEINKLFAQLGENAARSLDELILQQIFMGAREGQDRE